MGTHSKRSASGMYRWVPCPGSVRMSAGFPSVSTPDSERGTATHTLGEMCIREGCDAEEHRGRIITTEEGSSFPVDDAMIDAIQVYIDAVRDTAPTPGDQVTIELEKRVNLDWLFPDMYGTCDCLVMNHTQKRLSVIDYKNGYNAVHVNWNPQLLYYGLAAAHGMTEEQLVEVELVIVQPNAPKGEPVERSIIAPAELRAWGVEVLLPAAMRTEDPQAPLFACETWCKWCPAKLACPTLKQHMNAVTQTHVMAPTLPTVESLDPAELVKVIDSMALISAWAKEAKAIATEKAEMGIKIPGMKLVRGVSRRKFREKNEVLSVLSRYLPDDIIHREKFNTLGNIEKALNVRDLDAKGIMALVTDKPEAGLTLVAEDDRREEVIQVESMFSIEHADVFK